MQTFQILLNKSYTSTTISQVSQQLTNEYYMYQTNNGGGIVNFSNVRGFLNDSKNQQIINDFFAYLTGSTTKEQTINIVSSDEKLSNVFNDYYQRLTKSASTRANSSRADDFSSLTSALSVDSSSSQGFSITILNNNEGSSSPSSESNSSPVSNFNTSNVSLGSEVSATSAGSNTSVSPTSQDSSAAVSASASADVYGGLSDSIPQIPKYSMTATIAKNLAGGFGSIEKVFYHDWASEIFQIGRPNPNLIPAIAIKQELTGITLSIAGGTLSTRTKNIWVDTTSEESYYIPVYLQRSTNQISRNSYSADLIILPKRTLSSYPEYSGITEGLTTTPTSTRISTILDSFVDLNIETDESKFYAITIAPIAVAATTGGNTAPTGTA